MGHYQKKMYFHVLGTLQAPFLLINVKLCCSITLFGEILIKQSRLWSSQVGGITKSLNIVNIELGNFNTLELTMSKYYNKNAILLILILFFR